MRLKIKVFPITFLQLTNYMYYRLINDRDKIYKTYLNFTNLVVFWISDLIPLLQTPEWPNVFGFQIVLAIKIKRFA